MKCAHQVVVDARGGAIELLLAGVIAGELIDELVSLLVHGSCRTRGCRGCAALLWIL
jgi:hypothetical protein